MITTAAWVCASMAAGDLESPRLAIEFFNASNAFISFVADEDTSELFLDSQGSRALIGFGIESGPVDITLLNNSSSADVLLFDLDNGLQDSIAAGSEEGFSLSDGRYAIESPEATLVFSWAIGESEGLNSIYCPSCMIVQSGDNFTISPSRGSTASLGFSFPTETIQNMGVIGTVTSSEITVPTGNDEQEVTFPAGESTLTVDASPSTFALSALTLRFGSSDESDPSCPSDVDGDGSIGFSDVLAILSDWGTCP